jgi:phosphonate transport system substrate-binding protein
MEKLNQYLSYSIRTGGQFIVIPVLLAIFVIISSPSSAYLQDYQPKSIKPIKIAVAPVISPRASIEYYVDLFEYIGKLLNCSVEIVQRKTYTEINDLLASGKVDVAFVCSGAYIEGHDKFGMELLVAPKAYGQPVYYSYIIVPRDSEAKSLKDLKGKVYAFTDPLSNSGRLVPTYMLVRLGETPESFFKQYIYTHSHDNSIEAVARKIVDGASVDSLVWEYFNATDPRFTSHTKVIEKSPPYPIPPVVVRPGIDPKFKQKLRDILLSLHKDPRGKGILAKLRIEKFIILPDEAYNILREMRAFIKKEDND